MTHERTTLRTLDGDCPSHVFTPAGQGPWPGVIFYMDGFGLRPILFEMAQRLADDGYVVLLPDLFYREGPHDPVDVRKLFASGDVRKAVSEAFDRPAGAGNPTNNRLASDDTAAFLDYLTSRSDVAGTGVGVTGYCMGGGMALTAAGTYPDRIVAAASFHGGDLATDSEMSPHRLAGATQARLYIGAAENDPFYPPWMAQRYEQALKEAGVEYAAETYQGAAHGWTMADAPPYNAAAAERHWDALLAFFKQTLH